MASTKISYSPARKPTALAAVCYLSGVEAKFEPNGKASQPELTLPCGAEVVGDHAIMRYLARASASATASLYGADAAATSAIDSWMDFALSYLAVDATVGAKVLDKCLKPKTYLVGYSLTLADVAVWNALSAIGWAAPASFRDAARWYAHVGAALAKAAAKSAFGVAETQAALAAASSSNSHTVEVGSCPPLKGAVEGRVCTRFPPEPSGYLHIGHVKAALLNAYYAKRYKGKLIVRMDDTNPSKEKQEFADNILKDLATLGIEPDRVTHTSDDFDVFLKHAEAMIAKGQAYMDNTEQMQMRDERMNGIDGKCRDAPVAENVALWNKFKVGKAPEWCMRVKISMQHKNKRMRDPVCFRGNDTPHQRTGDKYKVYPCYDFSCPIIDSLDGVTHALRTTEYNDADELYHWLLKTLGMRDVEIHSFGRVNFQYSVLSKRKLQWFVDQGVVEGWFDPRFPTVQGIVRRGVTVGALQAFIYAQGASRRIVDMEWDKFWAINKKFIDATAKRFFGIPTDSAATLTLSNGPSGHTGMEVSLHPKNPALGKKVLHLGAELLIEADDAKAIAEGDEVTLMRWGNIKITKKTAAADGSLALVGELTGSKDYAKTKHKVTWLKQSSDLVECVIAEFDFLVTKAKMEEGDDFKDFLTPQTRADTPALGDPAMRNLQKGDVVQLERRGYYRVDRPYLSAAKPLVLFTIPDGKQGAMSTLSTKLTHR